MKKHKLTSYLGIFFIVAVIIPSSVLSIIAVRSMTREEAYIEKQLQGTLLVEATHTVSVINNELRQIQRELSSAVGVIDIQGPEAAFLQWSKHSSLVGVPFLLSEANELLWPNPKKEELTQKEKTFISSNASLLEDEVSIPVYENIAVAYKEDILRKSPDGREATSDSSEIGSEEKQGAVETTTDSFSRDYAFAPRATTGVMGVASSQSHGESSSSQRAVSQFSQYEPIRKRVYEQAKVGGKQTFYRSVNLPQKISKPAEVSQQLESIFISEPLKFSQIIAKGDEGIIPRFIDEGLRLLFWKKDKSGHIVGCMIDQNMFKERIIALLPDIYSTVRVLTVLDENGTPLITPQEKSSRDWRRPFVAREISELVPRWEVAAYLTDPKAISSRANTAALIMWILIFILFVSIVSGGTVTLRSLHSQMKLAQEKSTFVANVSHELKTPLTSIRMFVEMLKEKRQTDEQKKEQYLDIMSSETERLTRLINNVLDFSRMEQGKKQYDMKKADAFGACESIVEGQRIRLENNGFQLSFTTDIRPLFVMADEEAIKQAVLNLISNAEKYSTDTKKIEIELRRQDKFAIINIMDRGIGISVHHAKNIFKEFYRVDDCLTSKVRGTGLGLTIARRIVQEHGGDIVYVPRDGGGSIFQIKLPIVEE